MSGQEHVKRWQEDPALIHKRSQTRATPAGTRWIVVALASLGLALAPGMIGQRVSASGQYDRPTVIWSNDRTTVSPTAGEHPKAPDLSTYPTSPDPAPSLPVGQQTGLVKHVVREGDTLSQIAERHQVSVDSIREVNNLDSDLLQIDQQLLVPLGPRGLHTVRDGDTIQDIATTHEVEPRTILSANKISNPDVIQAGTMLVIPYAQPQQTEERPRMVTVRGGNRDDLESSGNTGVVAYEVRPGDTLTDIANTLGVSVSTIANANSIPDPNRLTAGQELSIPSTAGVLHTVQDGDSITWMAARYGVTVQDIVAANKLASPNLIRPGNRIVIPAPAAVPGSHSSAPSDQTASTSYSVRPGDTLLGIAYRLGVEADAIARANVLAEPFFLRDGQVLQVPVAGGQQRDNQNVSVASANEGTRHAVVAGDTVYGLAVAGKVSPDAIIAASRLEPPYILRVGQELIIPGASGDVHEARASAAPGSAPRSPAPAAVPATPAPLPPVPTSSSAPAPAPEPTGLGSRVVQMAIQFRGYRYTWGGSSPSTGFDCSGLVYYVYQQAGRPIPRSLEGQLDAGPRVSRDDLRPGDIVFFVNTYMPGLSHDGIYIGDGKFISANNENVGVIINSLSEPYWGSRYYAANRP